MLVRLSNNQMNATVMKDDRQMTVNIDRIRPYDDGVASIEDQHKRDIELAETELQAINDTISELQRKQRQLMLQQQASHAGVTIEQSQSRQHVDDDDDECKYPETEAAAVNAVEESAPVGLDDDSQQAEPITFNQASLQYDDTKCGSSWGATCLTSIDLVMLW